VLCIIAVFDIIFTVICASNFLGPGGALATLHKALLVRPYPAEIFWSMEHGQIHFLTALRANFSLTAS